jgi:CRP/FNR family transcriptional regulator
MPANDLTTPTVAEVKFAGIIRSELLSITGVKKIAPCSRLTRLYSPGGPARSLFFLDAGLVKLVKPDTTGRELLLGFVRPGELFGEEAVLGQARTMYAEAMEESVAYEIPRGVFRNFCERKPRTWSLLTRLLLRRQSLFERKLELLFLQGVEQRIVRSLVELIPICGVQEAAGGAWSIRLSQRELASLVGATRETTSTTLNALARRGLIDLGRRRLVIASLDAIRSAVETE